MGKKYWAFIGISCVAFVSFLEYMVVNNALPEIQKAFQVTILQLQFISNVYSIVLAVSMILIGKLGDIFGYRKLFYIGILLLIIGSLFAGMALSFDMLLIARGIQSIGISIALVIAPGLIQIIFKEKAQYLMGIYASITGVGLALGPYLGGVIVTYLGWRWTFYINIPILIIAFIFCIPFVNEYKASNSVRNIDWWGNILLIISLSSFISLLIDLPNSGITWQSISYLVIFIVSLIVFIVVENKQVHPMLNLHFFNEPYFVLAALSCFIAGAVIPCGMFFSPLFLQNVLLLSPTRAGVILLTFAIGVVLFAPLVNRITKRVGLHKCMLMGLLFGGSAIVVYIIFIYYKSVSLGVLAFLLTGLSLAVNNAAAPLAATRGAGHENAGVAVGTIFAIFNIMGGISIAIASLIYHVVSTSRIFSNANNFGFLAVFVFLLCYSLLCIAVGVRAARQIDRRLSAVSY